jgi:drug/metabolite transporter (DMT)-like permease
VGALLGLLSAVSYGAGDFAAGLAGRRYASGPVTAAGQGIGLLAALLVVVLFAAHGPGGGALAWGALSGVGSAVGTLSLYQGLAVGQMSVVASLSAVITAVVPVIVGIALGDHLGAATAIGIVIAVAAIALVSWQPDSAARGHRSGAELGLLAGVGFALLLIALDRAGTRSGAWPLVPGQAVSLALLVPVAVRGVRRAGRPGRSAVRLMLTAGGLSGTGNILFLAATGRGALSVVAVLTALYPAVTVLLARLVLDERWSRRQAVGLLTSAVAIVLVSLR